MIHPELIIDWNPHPSLADDIRHAQIIAGSGELSKFAVKVVNHPRGPVTR